eukprot:CAMPEP_0184369186 /NCGR_PEP_ID=MMETSP1089-20130417/162104_1 /TAXON_ID=38269 ORGANISM="Gloeochaete wittrockiana, Strain SAG46.84" /NCGR_SAMPLE_ID=MMETSP1089 /ASSEMBLY_ACC=CAM_ASM_000445 /LENGTH=213 /DNA_ID=CAMNT_0026711601 /DNA_START=384 /DNA_END=1025 /DNA_ORIENTATION=-
MSSGDSSSSSSSASIQESLDPAETECLHPLQSKWAWYFDKPQSKHTKKKAGPSLSEDDWKQKLKKIYEFEHVENFWRLYNNIAPGSKLQVGWNYYLFKSEIYPSWEDPSNKDGGSWTINFQKSDDDNKKDEVWLHTALACIGECLTYSEEVCGAVFSSRARGSRIEVWIKKATEDRIRSIGSDLKGTLDLQYKIEYIGHNDRAASSKGGKISL